MSTLSSLSSKRSDFPKYAQYFKVSSISLNRLILSSHSQNILVSQCVPTFPKSVQKMSSLSKLSFYQYCPYFPIKSSLSKILSSWSNIFFPFWKCSHIFKTSTLPNMSPFFQRSPYFHKTSLHSKKLVTFQNVLTFLKCPHFVLTFPKCPQKDICIWKKM